MLVELRGTGDRPGLPTLVRQVWWGHRDLPGTGVLPELSSDAQTPEGHGQIMGSLGMHGYQPGDRFSPT